MGLHVDVKHLVHRMRFCQYQTSIMQKSPSNGMYTLALHYAIFMTHVNVLSQILLLVHMHVLKLSRYTVMAVHCIYSNLQYLAGLDTQLTCTTKSKYRTN